MNMNVHCLPQKEILEVFNIVLVTVENHFNSQEYVVSVWIQLSAYLGSVHIIRIQIGGHFSSNMT